MKKIFYILSCMLFLASCAGRNANLTDDGEWQTVAMRHASLLTVQRLDSLTRVTVRNPWDTTKVLRRYVLAPEGCEVPEDETADVVCTPLRNAAVATSVHCALFEELGEADAVKGVCDLDYNYLPFVRNGVQKGTIENLGNSMSPDVERLIALRPDGILVSPFEQSGSYGRLGELAIPIIECADYMETSPLGRAEWIRFYGMLLGKERMADSLFACIEQRYDHLRQLASKASIHPTVVTEMKTGSTWYVAGGQSTVGILISDAGGDYIFKDDASSGSRPYSPEQAFARAQKADYWLIKYNQQTDMTLTQLAAAWPANSSMAAFKSGRTYGCNLSNTMFYEKTPFHPDILLKEYVSILHPELIQLEKREYFKPLSK